MFRCKIGFLFQDHCNKIYDAQQQPDESQQQDNDGNRFDNRMVDSLLDNLTLRTHRRALLNLELRSQTSHEDLEKLLQRLEALLKGRDEVSNHTVVFNDITKDAFVVQV